MLRFIAGAALVVAYVFLREIALRRIFDAWRRTDRRAWAEAVRPVSRRVMPFRAFLWSRVTAKFEFEWQWSTPPWAAASPHARRWLRIYRWSGLLVVAGWIVIMSRFIAG
jgi:hypothetical protein